MSENTQQFEPLYKTTSTGAEQVWIIRVLMDGAAAIVNTEWGQVDGAKQETNVVISKGKNVGKKNETTPFQQAMSEAESKWKKQLDKGYSVERGGQSMAAKPMLAHKYEDHKKKITFESAYVQPKLDGCVSGDTILNTKDDGNKTIAWIIENNYCGEVLSYNLINNQVEYKSIINKFVNRNVDEDIVWYEIELDNGKRLKLTGNHKVYIKSLNCWQRVDELNGNESLLLME